MISHPTAYYVFDLAAARARAKKLRDALGTDIAYAVKANLYLAGALSTCTERLEICSPGEYRVCAQAGIPAEKCVISGVYKDPAFLRELIFAGRDCVYTIESLHQLALLDEFSRQAGRTLRVLPRLTNGSQFGINADELVRFAAERESYPYLQILGVQFFSGTQKSSEKKLRREIAMLTQLRERLESEAGFSTEELEYGTGSPVAYFVGENLDEDALFAAAREALAGSGYPRITVELGRALAAPCGEYYTHVVDKKRNDGQNYLLLDGGLHQLVYYGQYMGMRLPFVRVIGREEEPPADEWNLCGSLCSMNDILAKSVPLPPVEIGDTLCFGRTGAYCVSEGMALFLTRDLPAVYLRDGEEITLARPTIETSALFNGNI